MAKYYPMRKTMRWQNFDYSTQGAYFVTIVTQDRHNLFGEIVGGDMIRNEAGAMVAGEYEMLEKRFKDIGCMDYVVMPNHFHAVIYLPRNGETCLTEVVDAFKSRTTVAYARGVREQGWLSFDDKLWQRSYWDDIIWNGRQMKFVQRYIALNPQRWDRDKINVEHNAEVDNVLRRFKTYGY